jgi:hypothetical protein
MMTIILGIDISVESVSGATSALYQGVSDQLYLLAHGSVDNCRHVYHVRVGNRSSTIPYEHRTLLRTSQSHFQCIHRQLGLINRVKTMGNNIPIGVVVVNIG